MNEHEPALPQPPTPQVPTDACEPTPARPPGSPVPTSASEPTPSLPPAPGASPLADPVPARQPEGSRLPAPLCEAVQDELLARATLSRLSEPADPAACALVGALGGRGALAWLLAEGLGPDGAAHPAPRPPLSHAGDAARASKAWRGAVERWAPRLPALDIRRELGVLERLGGSLLIPGDPRWPAGLDELELPPHCLWVRGDAALLAQDLAVGEAPTVALVGSRAATRYGERVATDMASELAAAGCVVVSGGAYGIDAAAHRGALATGRTIAVSAGGVDRLYPAGNAALLEEVVRTGALVAEVPPGCQPARHRFLTRNRLIAAMTAGTVVIEAAWRSGALSTARHARDLGRPLGAVPGPVTSMESAGCHRLLRDGAVCVTDARDALELISPVGAHDPDAARAADERERGAGLLDGLDPGPSAVLDAMPARSWTHPAAVARSAGLSEREALAALGLLELAGRVERDGPRWRRRRAAAG